MKEKTWQLSIPTKEECVAILLRYLFGVSVPVLPVSMWVSSGFLPPPKSMLVGKWQL